MGPTVSQRMLVLILNFSACGYKSSLSATEVRSSFFGSDGVALKYTQCSYGQFNLNATAFRAIVVTPTCTSNMIASCLFYGMASRANTAARAALGNETFDSFTHYAYILPPSLQSICGWAGLALLPGKQIWLQTSSYGVDRWATVMQESLHNYGT